MKIDSKDITLIHSMACKAMTDLSGRSRYKNADAQTYAFAVAMIQFLNGKNLLKEEIDIDDNLEPRFTKD